MKIKRCYNSLIIRRDTETSSQVTVMTARYYKDSTGLPSVPISKEFLMEILFIIYFYCAIEMVE